MKFKVKNILKIGTVLILAKLLFEEFWQDCVLYNYYLGVLVLIAGYVLLRVVIITDERKSIFPIIEAMLVISITVGVGFLISYLFDISLSMTLAFLSVGLFCSNRKSIFTFPETEKEKPKAEKNENKSKKSKVKVTRKVVKW